MVATSHVCQPPTLAATAPGPQPDWQCAECGRVFRDCVKGFIRWWAEICGPLPPMYEITLAGPTFPVPDPLLGWRIT